ncbi:MAG: hypothetical protein QM739_09565 [Propionivibrio sp.]
MMTGDPDPRTPYTATFVERLERTGVVTNFKPASSRPRPGATAWVRGMLHGIDTAWRAFTQDQANRRNERYRLASREERIEYDGFGPWLVPLQTMEAIPTIFRPWHEEIRDAAHAFKFPVAVDRRDAIPGMLLYDRVLVVSSSGILYLESAGHQVIERRHAMASLRAIRNHTDLLTSTLTLYWVDGSRLALDYNTISNDFVEAAIAYVRGRIEKPGYDLLADKRLSMRIGGDDVDDLFYLGLLEKSRRRSGFVRILVWDRPGFVVDRRWWRRRYGLGCLVIAENQDIAIFDHGKPRRKRSEAVFARSELYIPGWAILGVTQREDSCAITFSIERHEISVVLSRSFPAFE